MLVGQKLDFSPSVYFQELSAIACGPYLLCNLGGDFKSGEVKRGKITVGNSTHFETTHFVLSNYIILM